MTLTLITVQPNCVLEEGFENKKKETVNTAAVFKMKKGSVFPAARAMAHMGIMKSTQQDHLGGICLHIRKWKVNAAKRASNKNQQTIKSRIELRQGSSSNHNRMILASPECK